METNLTEIDNESICPEGWRLYDGELVAGDPCPVLSYMGNLYVPKSRQPRKTLINGMEAWAWSNGLRSEIGVGWAPPEEPRTIYAVRTTLVGGELVIESMQAELEECWA